MVARYRDKDRRHRQEGTGDIARLRVMHIAAALRCSIFWMPNAVIAPRNLVIARPSLRTCWHWSSFAKPWASGTCLDLKCGRFVK